MFAYGLFEKEKVKQELFHAHFAEGLHQGKGIGKLD